MQNYEKVLKTASLAFKLVSIVMVALLVTYLIKYQFYSAQISDVKNAYVKEFITRFPDAKRKYAKVDVPFGKVRKDAEMRLKEEIRFKQDAVAEFQLINTQSPTLRLLKEVSAGIPKELKVDVSLFEYRSTGAGNGEFTLKAETDNFSSGASIIEALAKVPSLKQVEEKQSGAKPGSEGKIIELTVNAKYEAIP